MFDMENYALLTIFAPQPFYAKNKSQTLGMVGHNVCMYMVEEEDGSIFYKTLISTSYIMFDPNTQMLMP